MFFLVYLQLQCVGGSAGCNTYVPQVVQCYNRGSDGVDVQVTRYHTVCHPCFKDST